MYPFRRLAVWKKAHRAALKVYLDTKQFPPDERFALVTQMRRAAISVGSNLAEGSKRNSPRDHAHFVNIAESSATELSYQYEVAGDLKYLPTDAARAGMEVYDSIAMELYKFRRTLENQVG